jgi:hypothetical protein
MSSFNVSWSKTYVSSGTVEIEAETEEEAERITREKIGDLTGSMQYDPNEDYVEVLNEIKEGGA